MKSLLVMVCVLWVALSAELAQAELLPHGSVLLPVACGMIFWTRSALGILVAGIALLVDWVARPGFLPLCPMVLPFLAVLYLSPTGRGDPYRGRSGGVRIPAPLQLPLLTIVAMGLQIIGSVSLGSHQISAEILPQFAHTAQRMAVVALPVSAVLSLIIRVADEFGMRRTFS